MKTNRKPQIVRLLHGSPKTIAQVSNAIDIGYEPTRVLLKKLLDEGCIELYTVQGTKPIRYYVPLRRNINE